MSVAGSDPTGSGPVEGVYQDFRDLRESLVQDPSGLVALERIYPKALLLAAASHLEHLTVAELVALFEAEVRPELRIFVEKKALARQYHTLFDWKGSGSAAVLFGFFGSECKGRFDALKKSDDEYADCVNAFLQIGGMRNLLVHNNYADFQMSKTAEEIFDLYVKARGFPPRIREIVHAPTSDRQLG